MNIAYIVSPNYDYLASSIIEGLTELGHAVYTTENSNYGYYLSRTDFCRIANNCELLIIGSGRFTDYSYLKQIQHPKTIYVDGSDYPGLESNSPFPVNLIFKRELLKSDILAKAKSIFPLPFAAEKRYFDNLSLKRTIPVSFVCAMSNYMRRSIKESIKSNFANCFVGSTGERAYNGTSGVAVSTPKYSRILDQSMISVNAPGKGWDCARYWEIIAHRACLVTQRIEIEIPNPFIEDQHFLAFSDMGELIEKVNKLLDSPSLASELSNAAFEHLCLYHTSRKRAEYLLATINANYVAGKVVNFDQLNDVQSRFYYARNWSMFKAWKAIQPVLPGVSGFKSDE